MSGKRSRDKGARGEREAAAFLRQWGIVASRGCQRSGSPDSPDVRSSLDWVHWEVKRAERLALYGALDQALADAGPDRVPVVLHRRNLRRWVVVMDAVDFVLMAKKVRGGE